MTKRILAFCLSVMMLLSALPVQAFATDLSTEPVITEETAAPTAPIEEAPEEETLPSIPETTVPVTTVPVETVVEETLPVETLPEETLPEETFPEETEVPILPEETLPAEPELPVIPEETVPEEEETVIAAPAAASGTYGALTWNYENETLTISGSGDIAEGSYPWAACSSAAVTLVLEEGVTAIGPYAFQGFTALTNVTLPGTVKTIGIAAFAACTSLTQIAIPEGVETIDFVAFQECDKLTDVSLPLSLTAINSWAFNDCSINDVYYAGDASQWSAIAIGEGNEALTEAAIHFADGSDQESTKPSWKLEDGVLTISGTGAMEDYAKAPWYSERSSIHTLVVGEGITYIGANAFQQLTALTSVTLPETLTQIGMQAFTGCSKLAELTLPASLNRIGTAAFSGCASLSRIDIPEKVTLIAEAAFSECGKLSYVSLPAGLETIGDFAFQDCPVSQVYFDGSDLQWCSVTIGQGNDALTEADIYYSEVTGSSTGKCGDDLTWLLADGMLTISGTGDMYDYSGDAPWVSTARSIRMLTVENGVTSIGKYAFTSCLGLTSVSLPETLVTIGEGAFATCSALTEITIPEGVKSIASAAFIDCSKLSSITLPASLTEIGMCAFPDPPLTTVHYGSTMADWNAITIGEENTALLNAARFYSDGAISGVWGSNLSWTLVDGKLTITGTGDMKAGTAMPWNTYKNVIHTVIIGNGITSVPANSFGTFPKLVNLKLPGSLVRIGDGAFATCSALEEVVIPEGLEEIGAAVFIDCGKLSVVHLPSTLKTVGDFAFRDCPLTDVYYSSTEENWERVSIGMENEALTGAQFHFLSGPADFDVFSGKALTLSAINPETGKAYTTKQITWTLAEEFEPFASVKSNKLTAKKVFETVRVIAVGTIAATGETVTYKIDIHPALTHLFVLDENGANISGKTVLMDFSEESLTLTADILPETMAKVTWTVNDSKNAYAEEYAANGNTLTILKPKAKAGTVTIKATAEAGVKKTVTVKVTFGSFAKTMEITDPENTALKGGESLKLTASITEPQTVTKPGIVWSVSDKTAATVSNGTVKAKNVAHPTKVTVTATSKDGKASDTVELTILPKNEGQLVLMNGSTFVTNSTKALNVGAAYQLSAAVITNGEPEPKAVTWTTSKASVAAVDENGLVTAAGAGTAKITAQLDKMKVSMTVKVSTLVDAMEITVKDEKSLITENEETIVLVSSGKAVTLVANILTKGANKAVTWEITEGGQYAKIANGKLTANKDLTKPVYATVKATAKDGSGTSATIRVKIVPLATGVQIYESGTRVRSNTVFVYDMVKNPALTLSAKVYPFTANQEVQLTSSNKKTADFNENGELVCYKPGTVTITAKALDGSNQKATFKLTIIKKIQSITFKEAELKQQLRIDADGAYVLAGGKSVNLSTLINIAPADATNKKLTWRVAPSDVGVTISSSGNLKAPKVTEPITVNVMGTSQDDSGQMVSFNVRVYPAATRVIIQRQTADGWEPVTGKTIEVKAGTTLQLRSVLEPNGCYSAVTWKSSNTQWAEVSEDGTVTGGTVGKTVTITCTAADGSAKKATFKVKVVE